ncbi:MAG: PLP-dependent aminotransferase family protein, partial [Candidatus Firestonebacteria bacterium]|nr:PLP-dependent aminotransferase family protein [Candidatus Firestonebacteria bacterium]
KLLDNPEMISFAGGLPNPAAFPIEPLKSVVAHVMAEHAREALQYGVTEGHQPLRAAIAKGMGEVYGAPQNRDNILVTTGSQQAMNLLAQVLLNPGDLVLVENPTYLGALQSFQACRARVASVPMDADGLRPDALEEMLQALHLRGERPKFLYLIPTFQNPTGVTLSRERRHQLYTLLQAYDLLLIEDDPYGLLRFEGEPVSLIKSLDHEDRVVYLGSFSKILAPGFRTGWLAAPAEITNRVSIAKQAQDLCSNTFAQYCVFEALHHDILFPHVQKIIALYREKRDRMLTALEKYFPSGVTWTHPQGGMFIWVTLPPALKALELLKFALAENVAYVNGEPFFANGGGENHFRLNYSYARDEDIDEGIARLGRVITRAMI